MKILIISDTHGKLSKFREIYKNLNDIDLIVHCGDYAKDAISIGDELGKDVFFVKGNCDGSNTSDDFKILKTEFGNIFVTHGHMLNIRNDYQKLCYKALENNCKAVFFGHSHIPCFEESDGLYLVNPGSLTLPKDNTNGSYAIVHTSADDFYGSIVYYDTVCGTKVNNKNQKIHGGYLRDLLNYSDRF